MYKAEGRRGNRYEFYERTMTQVAFQRMSLESTLRKALDRNELELHYQPQVDIYEGRLIGWRR
jgi:sensor c-di-GMP phosphodiesterase-like protein